MRRCDLQRMISHFRGKPEVSALYVFGARSGPAPGKREACLGVLVDGSLLGGRHYESVLEECVPVLDPDVRDVLVMNLADPFVKFHIIRKGSVVFEKNPGHRVRFTAAAVREFYNSYSLARDEGAEEGLEQAYEVECVELDC
ncbi:MAG: hypothetical protein Kow0025_14130 [Thermodesulfovibrionales bacterium]